MKWRYDFGMQDMSRLVLRLSVAAVGGVGGWGWQYL